MTAIVETLLYALGIYRWIVIIACVFSLLYAFRVIDGRNQFVNMIGRAVYQLTEPVLGPIRRFLPNMNGMDFSPIVLFIIIFFIERLLINLAYSQPLLG